MVFDLQVSGPLRHIDFQQVKGRKFTQRPEILEIETGRSRKKETR